MLKAVFASVLLALPAVVLAQQTAKPATPASGPVDHPRVLMHTTQGDFTLELFPEKAPKSVANFLQYVRDGFYDGTVFHRAVNGYLVRVASTAATSRSAVPVPPFPVKPTMACRTCAAPWRWRVVATRTRAPRNSS